MTIQETSPLVVSDVSTVDGSTVKVESLGNFAEVYGRCTCFVRGKLLMVIGGPLHLSATVTTLFRQHDDGIFRYIGFLNLKEQDGKVSASLCGQFEHAGWVNRQPTGSSMECELLPVGLYLSAQFRFVK